MLSSAITPQVKTNSALKKQNTPLKYTQKTIMQQKLLVQADLHILQPQHFKRDSGL